jgi:hypothetical protein
MPDDFSFAVGDRVANVFPINSGKIGTVTGQYGRYDNIPRETDTVLATTPWTDLMYTVKWDRGGEDIVEESRLVSLDDFNASRARR